MCIDLADLFRATPTSSEGNLFALLSYFYNEWFKFT